MATATIIPSLFRSGKLWLVEFGPLPKDRYQVEAPDAETAIAKATERRR